MLVKFLEDNIDVFAWSTYDVPRINLKFICHQLNVKSSRYHGDNRLGDLLKSMQR